MLVNKSENNIISKFDLNAKKGHSLAKHIKNKTKNAIFPVTEKIYLSI